MDKVLEAAWGAVPFLIVWMLFLLHEIKEEATRLNRNLEGLRFTFWNVDQLLSDDDRFTLLRERILKHRSSAEL